MVCSQFIKWKTNGISKFRILFSTGKSWRSPVLIKSPAGSRSYGGEKVNEQTIRWEKGPSDNIFLRVMTIVSVAPDSSQPIAQAVRNSNVDPIAAAFDIKAYGKDSTSVVIDVTDFFKLDNQPVSLSPDIEKKI